jgi:hypothetical protein
MPTTENDRRNQQQPIPTSDLPDHDRRKDPGMHTALPEEYRPIHPTPQETAKDQTFSDHDENETAPPDQEFQQILQSGPDANQGKIPEDPNNRLTSDQDTLDIEQDPESRGESLPDVIDNVKH